MRNLQLKMNEAGILVNVGNGKSIQSGKVPSDFGSSIIHLLNKNQVYRNIAAQDR